MKTQSASLLLATCALTLTACIGGGGGGRLSQRAVKMIDRALVTAPGKAQPSAVVATEVAYRQTSDAVGQYAAAKEFSTNEAMLHRRGGPVSLSTLSGTLAEPIKPPEWGPRTVVMSCTGELALSVGRFRDADGLFGTYVTTWVRQSNNTYKWSYDVAGLDDPQPPPREEFEDGAIVVTAMDSVLGLIADCPPSDGSGMPPPVWVVNNDTASKTQKSADSSLIWSWEHRPDGTKYVKVYYYYQGEWVQAVEEELASTPEE